MDNIFLDKNLKEYQEDSPQDIFNNSPKRSKKDEEEFMIWLSISESAKIAGVQSRTIRRAIKDENEILEFKIENNKYLINFKTLIPFMNTSTKLKNKLNKKGIGQYVAKWKKTNPASKK